MSSSDGGAEAARGERRGWWPWHGWLGVGAGVALVAVIVVWSLDRGPESADASPAVSLSSAGDGTSDPQETPGEETRGEETRGEETPGEATPGQASTDGTASDAPDGDGNTDDVGDDDAPDRGDPSADPSEPTATRTTAPPVALDEPAAPARGVTASITKIEEVDGVASLPGEVAGPGLRFTATVTNATDDELDLRGVVVNLYGGPDLAPALALQEPGGRPFPESLDAGERATGVFVFRLPPQERAHVRVEVDLAPTSTVVMFEGPGEPSAV